MATALPPPVNGGKYKNLKFWLKASVPDATDPAVDNAKLGIILHSLNGTKTLGYLPAKYFLEGDDVDLDYEMSGSFAGTSYGVTLTAEGLPLDAYLAIDNVEASTAPSAKMDSVMYEQKIPDDDHYNFWEYGVTGENEDPYTEHVSECTESADGVITLHITGLEPLSEYYFCPVSHYVLQESECQLQLAFGVAAPEVQAATNITTDAYTANWLAASKATGYRVNSYGVTEAQQAGQQTLLTDDFATVTGEDDTAVRIGNDSETSLNDYTTLPGWTGKNNITAKGQLGIDDAYYAESYLNTPAIYVGNNTTFALHVKAKGSYGDILGMKVDGKIYSAAFDASGLIDETFEIPCSSASTFVHFYSLGMMPVLFDEISVSQQVEKGAKVYTWLGEQEVSGGTTLSTEVSGLSAYGFSSYAYTVNSIYDREGERAISDASDYAYVTREQLTSIAGIDTTETGVKAVAIYDANGIRLNRPQHGLNIVKMSDGTVRKVMVK